ncbi:yxbC [Symbiodinium microadriaticum]|nr:yxbC [Symbiodinium microadriaticum]
MAKRPATAAHVNKRQRTRHKEASNFEEDKLLLSFDCRRGPAVDPSLEPEELVARLLTPLSREEFLKHCWAEKAVAVHGHPRRLAPIISRLSDLDLEAMLEESPSDVVHAWLRDGQDAAGGAASSALRSVAVDSAAAMGLRAAKAALYFRANEDLETLLVSQICAGLGAGAAGMYPGDGQPRGEIETFVASEGHVTGWHTDFQHNFTFQLRGAKRWRFKAGPVKNNVRALTPHFQTRSNFEQQMKLHLLSDPTEPVFRPPDDFFADAEEVELHAGSVLYHPAGIWHHVECLGEAHQCRPFVDAEEESISINVSLSIATWADLVGDAVRQLLWASPSLRQPLVGLDSVDPSRVRQAVGQKLKEAKRDFSKLTAEDLLPAVMLETPRLPSRIHLSKSLLGKDLYAQSFRFGQLASLVELPEETDSASDEELPKNARRYALHINFGNEDVGSWIRVVLVAPSPALRTAMAWLGKRQLAARAGARNVCFKAKESLGEVVTDRFECALQSDGQELVQASGLSWTQTTR